MRKKTIFTFFLFLISNLFSQNFTVLKSTDSFVEVEVDFNGAYEIKDTIINEIKYTIIGDAFMNLREPGEPSLPIYGLQVGVPFDSDVQIKILEEKSDVIPDKFIVPKIDDEINESGISGELLYNEEIYSSNKYYPAYSAELTNDFILRAARIKSISVAPYQFNPVTRQLKHNRYVKLRVSFDKKGNKPLNIRNISDQLTDDYLKNNTINYQQAITFTGNLQPDGNSVNIADYDWYNPQKKYLKVYVSREDVYTLSYNDLVQNGLDVNGISTDRFEMYSASGKVPIEIVDNGNGIFEAGDSIRFVGFPPPPSPYVKSNIYNYKNIYWLSAEADGISYQYTKRVGAPTIGGNGNRISYNKIFMEKDTLYERLGYALNGNRDYWYWAKISGDNGTTTKNFGTSFQLPANFDDSEGMKFTVRAAFHGITTGAHKTNIFILSQPIGSLSWDGQEIGIFEKEVSADSINLAPVINIQFEAPGGIANGASDEIRLNWIEIEFRQVNRVFNNYYAFNANTENFGNTTKIEIYRWEDDSLRVYIPQKGELLVDNYELNNGYDAWQFQDKAQDSTRYFVVGNTYVKSPDSLALNVNSDLRNTANGADYIIITHPDFMEAANELKAFRESNLDGYDNARVAVVNVFDIYNEFSYGLLDPNAIHDFLKYAYIYWRTPLPAYVVIMGDMSYDYRKLLSGSRPNFVPSIPYHSIRFGQAVSDNQFVTISGNDALPEMAIGRLTCETIEEANELVKKIKEYPADSDKRWQSNSLLIGAGQHNNDENNFGFNDQSLILDSLYIGANGYNSEKTFFYPNKPSHFPYEGGTAEIKNYFNQGVVMANFYGHGGGYQWDAVFVQDDIYLLENYGRLPFITSITCYTAHFDNQRVFGEIFNLLPDRGSIAFWGHTGLTFWYNGLTINNKLYDELFNNDTFVIGKAIFQAKGQYSPNSSSLTEDTINLLTLLGDPAVKLAYPENPDFIVNPNDISISPAAPLTEDSVTVTVNIENLGRIFPDDSVKVNMLVNGPDSSFQLPSRWLYSFTHYDTLQFGWIPKSAGLFNIEVQINIDDQIEEKDLSDNIASNNFSVFSLSEPSIIKPADGIILSNENVEFIIADVAEYINTDLTYFIEIDTSVNFDNPIVKSEALRADNNGIIRFINTFTDTGYYFWRSRIQNDQNFSNWSQTRSFRISDYNYSFGYYISENQLKNSNYENLIYSDEDKALVLSRETYPPEPRSKRRLQDAYPELPDDIQSLSVIATDGTYLYFGHHAYYGLITQGYTEESSIYKMGTGYNGTTFGTIYGTVSDLKIPIWKTMFYLDGALYIGIGDAYEIAKLDLATGDTTHVNIPSGLLVDNKGIVADGGYFLSTNGKYVYNLANRDSTDAYKYTLRVLDPYNNWSLVQPDTVLSGESFAGYCGFFMANDYLYVLERLKSNFMRKYDTNTFLHINEWGINPRSMDFYFTMVYDDIHDVVFAYVFGPDKAPRVSIFQGTYNDGEGSFSTADIGPASKWEDLGYFVDTEGSSAEYQVALEGFNKNINTWELLDSNVTSEYNLNDISADKFSFLRMNFSFLDTATAESELLKLNNIFVKYKSLPEMIISNGFISFDPDTLLQGFDITVASDAKNYGYTDADSVKLELFIDNADTAFVSKNYVVKADSIINIQETINTAGLKRDTYHSIRSRITSFTPEMFTFNNSAIDSFFVERDSTKPEFNITFDGREIIDGDLISSNPTVVITLDDDSPLPLQTENFTIEHTFNGLSNILSFDEADSLNFEYTPYPDSRATITWTPDLGDGNHRLDIFASDASSNPFSNTGYNITFRVDTENKIEDIYNYPNPFANDTWFTFTLTGDSAPEELNIRIFTVAGRLIREIDIPPSMVDIKLLNKFYWDGKDEDGSDIANGVYLYKVIAKYPDKTITEIKKMARVR